MFHDLDSTLARILDDVAAPPELRAADVSFETPQRNYAPTQTTVNLFLHQVREDRELRDPTPDVELVGAEYVTRVPPLRANCSYLVTTWSNATGPARVVEEHRLLAQALWWLTRFPTIPDEYLRGSLASQLFPPPTMVAQLEGERSTGEFWTALGTPPRPAFYLAVTVALDIGLELPMGPPVVTHELSVRQWGPPGGPHPVLARWLNIGGIVRDAQTHEAIAEAAVSLLQGDTLSSVQTQTDTQGRFRFSSLVPGQYTLRTSASGYPPRDMPITLPAAAQGRYDVELTS